ncbi:pyruvate formate lyase family protein [Shigella flexneri]
MALAWQGFNQGDWQNNVNVRDFIQKNYTPYEGDESFLAGSTPATRRRGIKSWKGLKSKTALMRQLILTLMSLQPSLLMMEVTLRKNSGKVVGLQTDAPLKCGLIPFGGIKMVEAHAKLTTVLDPKSKKSSLNTVKLTTKVFSMFTRQTS